MCRKCRFVKCLQCGMLPENVQAKRDKISDNPSVPDVHQQNLPQPQHATLPTMNLGPATAAPPSSMPGPSSSMGATSCSPLASSAIPPPSDNESTTSSSAVLQIHRPLAVSPASANGVPKLLQIETNYKMLCQLRRATELSLLNDDLKDIFDAANDAMRPVDFATLNKIMKGSVPTTADFCINTFTEFTTLAADEKWVVFQNLLASLWNTEKIYRTWRTFPNEENKKYEVTSCTTYIDLDNLGSFFDSTVAQPNFDPQNITLLMKKNTTENTRRIIRMFDKLVLSDIEFGALVGLIMWPPYLPKASDRILDIALGVRETIFRELHVYYSTILRMDDYAGRLGELMSLYSSLQWSTNRMKEDMELFKLFDVFAADSFFYDIIRN